MKARSKLFGMNTSEGWVGTATTEQAEILPKEVS